MKLFWILVTCLAASPCSSEEALENDNIADNLKSKTLSLVEESSISSSTQSQRSCKGYLEDCRTDCDCCDPHFKCHCFVFFLWNCKCFGGTQAEQCSTCIRKYRECGAHTGCGNSPCTAKNCKNIC